MSYPNILHFQYPSFPGQEGYSYYTTSYEILPSNTVTDVGSRQGSVICFSIGQPMSTITIDNNNMLNQSTDTGNLALQQLFQFPFPPPTPPNLGSTPSLKRHLSHMDK
ncbi:hypothetical protein QQ045_002837 [Rhodiola kirilowii]